MEVLLKDYLENRLHLNTESHTLNLKWQDTGLCLSKCEM